MAWHLAIPALQAASSLIGKFFLGVGAVYVSSIIYEQSAAAINNHLENNYPHIKFRLTPSMVEWGVETLKVAINTIAAEDSAEEFERRFGNMAISAYIEFIAQILDNEVPTFSGKKLTAEEIKILANGVGFAMQSSASS